MKRRIEGGDATSPGQKLLFFAGRKLDDSRTLSDYKVRLFLAGGKLEDGRMLGTHSIEDESTLHMFVSVSEPSAVTLLRAKVFTLCFLRVLRRAVG